MTAGVKTADAMEEPHSDSQGGDVRQSRRQGRRRSRAAYSLLAQGEPLLWLTSGGLVTCVLMIAGLLGLVLYHGLTTFWPIPVVSVKVVGDQSHMGEITRQGDYTLNYASLAAMSGPTQEAAGRLLHPRLHEELSHLLAHGFEARIAELHEPTQRALIGALQQRGAVRDAPGKDRRELLDQMRILLNQRAEHLRQRLRTELEQALAADLEGERLYELWSQTRASGEDWLDLETFEQIRDRLAADENILYQAWANRILRLIAKDVAVNLRRRLIRTGNFDLTNEHFNWVSDFEVLENSETYPEWAVVVERQTWGRFFGFPKALEIDEQAVASEPAEIWRQFQEHHPTIRDRWQTRRGLETHETGHINRELEEARLALRRVELQYGQDTPQWRAANEEFESRQAELDARFAAIRQQIVNLDTENERYRLIVETAQGQTVPLALADIVRAYPANQLNVWEKLGLYGSRWLEFLTDKPREANSEGGVFPAIFGTVVMTLLMSVAVVPFGVLAALYLHEYAKAGPMVSTVRIAVNNLAGVPSIVFGVFGLGFFCYIIGGGIDQLFYQAKLPNPTYGTGGVFWAALTLALLTLPVVIVATEEALAAVPRSMREGSLACGATKWQTIARIVLPRAMPGIMTGMILAMARGAGEVAPLMLVGAVKLAPELLVDFGDWSGSFAALPTGPLHPERSFMHLGFHIYDLGFQSQNSEAAKPMVFTTTLLLIAIIALMNVMAIWLRARLQKRFQYGQF